MSLLFRIWEENEHVFRAVAASVVHLPEHTDDVLQEAFARLLRRNRSFRSRTEAFHYVRTTVLNTAIDFYRKLSRQRKVQKNEISEDVFPCDGSYDPLGILIREQEDGARSRLLNEVKRAVEDLPPQDLDAIAVFFDRKSAQTVKQACAERGLAYSTLRGRMLRGVDRIRQHLRKEGVVGFDAQENES